MLVHPIVILYLFAALWFRNSPKRFLKLLAAGSVFAIGIIIYILSDRIPRRYGVRYDFLLTAFVVNVVISLVWAYLLYFVIYIVNLIRGKEKLPRISFVKIKNLLNNFYSGFTSFFKKLNPLYVLLTIIAILLFLIVVRIY